MPIKSKVIMQTLQKSQDRHKGSFAFEFNNKNTKKVFVIGFSCRGRFAPPPPYTIKLDFRKSQETVFIAPRTRGKDKG